MPNDEVLDQYKLLGEGTSIWLIAMLLLVGSVGAVASVMLILPPEMTMGTLKSWVISSNRVSPDTNPPGSDKIDTVETDKAALATGNNAASQPVEPLMKLAKTEIPEKSPPVVETVEEQALGLDTAPEAVNQRAKQDPSSMPTESETISFETSEETTRRSASITDVSNPNTVTQAEYAAMEMPEIGSTSVSITERLERDCAPLFVVHFDRGGTRPIDQDLSVKVNRIHAWLNVHPKAKVIIEGHTDSYGTEGWNLLVSQKRAKMVAKVLASIGVPERQMELRALGEYAPVMGLPPESARNRRVTLRIRDSQGCPTDLNHGDNP